MKYTQKECHVPPDWAAEAPLPAPRVILLLRGAMAPVAEVTPLRTLLPLETQECTKLPPPVRKQFAEVVAHRLLQAVSPERLDALFCSSRRSRYTRKYGKIHLANIFIFDPPENMSADEAARWLRRLPSVALAYVEQRAGRPCSGVGCGALEDLSGAQTQLLQAPHGLSARFVRTLPGGKGQRIPFALIDAGWNVKDGEICHCDLPAGLSVDWGISGEDTDKSHGMATLGLAVALQEGGGIEGIAPDSSPVHVLSLRSQSDQVSYVPNIQDQPDVPERLISPWNALVAAIDLLDPVGRPPGVILLENHVRVRVPQNNPNDPEFVWAPAEAEPVLRMLIGVAAAKGIAVIEPAGNGSTKVEETFSAGALSPQATASPAGAILVAACDAERALHPISNFGALVDCFGPGDNVPSLSFDNGSPEMALTSDFSGTSSASAIVAGAVLCVQAMSLHSNSASVLSLSKLRKHLRSLGTLPKEGTPDAIGRMPNLAGIAEQLGHAPVYFKDFPGHAGPTDLRRSVNSPDIWVGEAEMDVAALSDFTADSGLSLAGEVPIGHLKRGSQAHLRLRLRSRGGEALNNTKIELFFTPQPPQQDGDWRKIASLNLPPVPGEGTTTVSDSVVWDVPTTDVPDNVLIVAMLTSDCFPDFLAETHGRNGDHFFDFVRANPRVTFRRCAVSGP